jgi:hypothetical protein
MIYQNTPQLLSGLACAGVVSTVIFGAKATLKAQEFLTSEKIIFKKANREEKIEVAKEIGKIYLPTFVSGIATITCIIMSQHISTKRAAALAGLYSISKEALQTYQAKVVETIGDKAEKKIKSEINQEKVNNNPPQEKNNIYITDGSVLCYDSQTGRYFYSEYEKIRKIINDLNQRLINEMFIELNDLYYELELPLVKHGDELGWYIDQGLIDIKYDTMLSDKGVPCIVLTYTVQPKSTFN